MRAQNLNPGLMLSVLLATGVSGIAHAALIDRGSGLIYDNTLNVTWLRDVRRATSDGFSGAVAFANDFSYYDSLRNNTWSDWRLPKLINPDPACSIQGSGMSWGLNCMRSELANLYYNGLGGVGYFGIGAAHNSSYELFRPFPGGNPSIMRATLPYDAEYIDSSGLKYVWAFSFDNGHQGAYSFFGQFGVLLVRDGDVALGSTPTLPFLPDGSLPGGGWTMPVPDDSFVSIPTPGSPPRWIRGGYFDPEIATGYKYEVDVAGMFFTGTLIPNAYGDGVFDLYLWDEVLGMYVDSGRDVQQGEYFDFLAELGITDGLTKFALHGIEESAMVDPNDPEGFVTGLTFGGTGESFSMIPITTAVPEPQNYALLLAGFGLVGWRVRRRRGFIHDVSASRNVHAEMPIERGGFLCVLNS